MIQDISDAKHLIADMHNSILQSLKRTDTPIKREAIALLRDLFEEENYNITEELSDEIRFESKRVFPDDWSITGKRHHTIFRRMGFFWDNYDDEYSTITAHIGRHELYNTRNESFSELKSFFIDWSVSQQKVIRISK